jgi:hypothetical protein
LAEGVLQSGISFGSKYLSFKKVSRALRFRAISLGKPLSNWSRSFSISFSGYITNRLLVIPIIAAL